MTQTTETTTANRAPQRVRHELKFRALTVVRKTQLTPKMIRVTLTGDSLPGFHSPGFDDHAKIFFPDENTGQLTLPSVTPDGPRFPEGVSKPAARDYTPRHYDAVNNTLDIDFALHQAGPATRWAERAQPGDTLGVGGPRGSFIIPLDYDWHLLIGDDTALPAIARRLEELPAGARAVVIVEVDSESEQVPLPSAAQVSITWVYRRGAAATDASRIAAALRAQTLPAGEFYAWVACESSVAKTLRAQLIAEHGAQPKALKAAGYWRYGEVGVHDKHDDE